MTIINQPIYTYFVNYDGNDQLLDAILTPDRNQAKTTGDHMVARQKDPDYTGSIIQIDDPKNFIDQLTTGNPHQREQYFGYYYDEKTDEYQLATTTAGFSYDSAFNALGDFAIQHHIINANEITDTIIDGKLQDLENVLIDHECDVIQVTSAQIKNYLYRAQQI